MRKKTTDLKISSKPSSSANSNGRVTQREIKFVATSAGKEIQNFENKIKDIKINTVLVDSIKRNLSSQSSARAGRQYSPGPFPLSNVNSDYG